MLAPNVLKAARALLGVKQSDLARAAGISLATLNNFERGIGDPRASTMEAIERALARGGVAFSGDGEHDIVTLRKLQRPTAYDTYSASRSVLEALERNSLLNLQSAVFYRIAANGHDGEEHVPHVGILLDGLTRAVLFDQSGFALSTSSHVAEVAGILLAAYALYRDRLYFIPDFVPDTTRLSVPDAIGLLSAADWEKLGDPADLLELFSIGAERVSALAERAEHPLNRLLDFTQSRLRR